MSVYITQSMQVSRRNIRSRINSTMWMSVHATVSTDNQVIAIAMLLFAIVHLQSQVKWFNNLGG